MKLGWLRVCRLGCERKPLSRAAKLLAFSGVAVGPSDVTVGVPQAVLPDGGFHLGVVVLSESCLSSFGVHCL